jgi:hypothetical protein
VNFVSQNSSHHEGRGDIAPTIDLADPISMAHLEIIVEKGDSTPPILVMDHQAVVLPLHGSFAKSTTKMAMLLWIVTNNMMISHQIVRINPQCRLISPYLLVAWIPIGTLIQEQPITSHLI